MVCKKTAVNFGGCRFDTMAFTTWNNMPIITLEKSSIGPTIEHLLYLVKEFLCEFCRVSNRYNNVSLFASVLCIGRFVQNCALLILLKVI